MCPKYLGHDYYVKLLDRLVQSLQGKMPFPFMDWRFNEFPNESAHALYATSIEIMALPVIDPVQVSMEIRPSKSISCCTAVEHTPHDREVVGSNPA